MVRELSIQPPGDQFDWITKILQVQAGQPLIDGLLSTVLPTIDGFGSEKIDNVGYAEVLGGLGALEVLHNAPLAQGPNAPRFRIYTAMEYWHDDAAAHHLRAVRVVPEAGGTFPAVAFSNALLIAGDTGGTGQFRLAVRNATVGPGQQIGVRADAMGAGARITLRVHFVELQVGQYTRNIS